MKTFIILLSATIIATATVLYVPLPADVTKEQALNGNPEAKERIQQAIYNEIKQFTGDGNALSTECWIIVLTDHGRPILPKRTPNLEKSKGSIRYYRGSGWLDEEWDVVSEHVFGNQGTGNPGFGGLAVQLWGEPFFMMDVYISRTDNEDDNRYDIITNTVYLYWGPTRRDSTYFKEQGCWRLNRLLFASFRDRYFIDWGHFQAGMAACAATMIQDQLYEWESDCWMTWHGGPGRDRFNAQLSAVTYSAVNTRNIATGCHNFAGRVDVRPTSGNADIQTERTNACSMFWQKVYMADIIFGNSTFFRDFNLKLLQYGDAQPPDPAEYTPPDFETMYGWALDSVRSNSIENTPKSTWFYNQWIIQKEDDPNLDYGVFVRSIEDGDSEDGLMDHVCYSYRRFIDNAGYWEEPISNWDIRIRVNNQEPWTAYPSNPAGWVNGVPFGTKIPYPTSTPEPLIVDAQPHAVLHVGTIRDVSFLNRNQYEYFGYAYASGNPPLYVDVTNLDTGAMSHI